MDQWKIWLLVADGPNAGDVIPVGLDPFLIGRRPGCHFRPSGDGVADLHCALLARDARFFLRNVHQPGGTCVGGRQVLGGIELRDSDWFQVGEWRLEVRIARRPCAGRAAALSETDGLAETAGATDEWNVAWSAACLEGSSQFFVVCTDAGLQQEPPAADSPEQSLAPETVAELVATDDTVDHSAALPAIVSAPGENREASSAPGNTIEVELPALLPVEESTAGPVPATLPGDETLYLPLAALKTESETMATEANARLPENERPPKQQRRPVPRSLSLAEDRPERCDPAPEPPPPPRPVILVGRLDRAMPMLRQQGWEAANRPKVPVSAAPLPGPRKRWLPALGGVVLGMALVGVFYLAVSRALSAGPPRMPPRGRLHTGKEIFQQAAPVALPPPVEQQRQPRSDGSRTPPRGVPRGGGPKH